MKKQSLLICTVILFPLLAATQNKMKPYTNKTFIFNGYAQVAPCDNLGNHEQTPITALKGSQFTVAAVTNTNDLVINFLIFRDPSFGFIGFHKDEQRIADQNRRIYNFESNAKAADKKFTATNSNIKFFLISKEDFEAYCSEYIVTPSWDLTFGSFTTPFKFRYQPSTTVSNLNLGANISLTKRFGTNLSLGIIAGISLSSVTLDSASTNGRATSNTDRPAVTPTVDIIAGYKNINIIAGFGWDIVNRTSALENGWIYNNSRWFGFGIGLNLFTPSSSGNGDALHQSK